MRVEVEFRKEFDIDFALAAYCRLRTLNPDGSITLLGDVDPWESYFLRAVEVKNCSNWLAQKLIRNALRSQQIISKQTLKAEIHKAALDFNARGLRRFRVVTTLSSGTLLAGIRVKRDHVSIDFSPRPDSMFLRSAIEARASMRREMPDHVASSVGLAESYPIVVCSIDAVHPFDARERAMAALSVELGMLGLMTMRGRFIFASGPDKPLCTVLIGPYTTVHKENGELAVEECWYENWHGQPQTVSSDPKRLASVRKNFFVLRSELISSRWSMDARNALAKYYEAFAIHDATESFLAGWRVLEAIAGEDRMGSDMLVRRASAFHLDVRYSREVIKHLRHRRNSLIHGKGVHAEDAEMLRVQMKDIVRGILLPFVRNPFGLESKAEFFEFCDSPVEQTQRMRKLFVLTSVNKFRRGSPNA